MTDKQIIIDGVDVSGCDELVKQDDNTLICEITGYLCEDRQNCYYKQLKRAEKTMQEIWDRLGKTSDELLRKEQECDQLKAENKHLNDLLNQALKELEAIQDAYEERE